VKLPANPTVSAHAAMAFSGHAPVSAEKRIMKDMKNRDSRKSDQNRYPCNFLRFHEKRPFL
jgi:hypothetical protein